MTCEYDKSQVWIEWQLAYYTLKWLYIDCLSILILGMLKYDWVILFVCTQLSIKFDKNFSKLGVFWEKKCGVFAVHEEVFNGEGKGLFKFIGN